MFEKKTPKDIQKPKKKNQYKQRGRLMIMDTKMLMDVSYSNILIYRWKCEQNYGYG